MKYEYLSPNLVIVVNKLLENQDLLKLVNYNSSDALSQPDISNPVSLINTRIYPYPYNGVLTEQQTQIRVYYGNTKIKSRVVETTPVLFEVITHSDLYLINDPNGNGKKLLRLYEIANRITEQFDEVSVNTVGKLRFTDVTPVMGLPEGYQMVRLIGEMFTIGK